ncbi:hypothetical protein [Ruegeria arenilitoris]|uniref:hypothetical protein n=1 Tax=Ruegeria arenilitoris TaxID=1173585 RepID=UPI001C2C8F67|nr:hypothetical protein [Ruegeria arenilitoris]
MQIWLRRLTIMFLSLHAIGRIDLNHVTIGTLYAHMCVSPLQQFCIVRFAGSEQGSNEFEHVGYSFVISVGCPKNHWKIRVKWTLGLCGESGL